MLTDSQREYNRPIIIAMLALPDSPDLCGKRKYHYTYPGKPRNEREIIKMELERAYWSWYMADKGREESAVVSVRRYTQ